MDNPAGFVSEGMNKRTIPNGLSGIRCNPVTNLILNAGDWTDMVISKAYDDGVTYDVEFNPWFGDVRTDKIPMIFKEERVNIPVSDPDKFVYGNFNNAYRIDQDPQDDDNYFLTNHYLIEAKFTRLELEELVKNCIKLLDGEE